MKFLTEAQAEALANKVQMVLTEDQEFAIAKKFAEKKPWAVANFLVGNANSIKAEFRIFRKEEIASMRFNAWRDAAGARWDDRQGLYVIYGMVA